MSHDSFCEDDPWVVVTEDTGVLFVSRRIGGDFTEIETIGGIGRI